MIQSLWILNNTGICLFSRYVEGSELHLTEGKKIDDQLFSGLLTSIMMFASKISKGKIEKVKVSEGKFLFFTHNNLIFIVKADLNVSDKDVKKKINVIKEIFITKYKNQLESFDGEVSSFLMFHEDLDDIFKRISKAEKWGKALLDL